MASCDVCDYIVTLLAHVSLLKKAEREGFEPSDCLSTVAALAVRCNSPLYHLSIVRIDGFEPPMPLLEVQIYNLAPSANYG